MKVSFMCFSFRSSRYPREGLGPVPIAGTLKTLEVLMVASTGTASGSARGAGARHPGCAGCAGCARHPECTPLAHAGALTERVAAGGRRQAGALLPRLGKAKYHLFTPNAKRGGGAGRSGEGAEWRRLLQWGGVERQSQTELFKVGT